MANKILSFQFRWPIKQSGPQSIEVLIPLGNGPQVLNPEFCKEMALSDGEQDKAESLVLRAIAIIE
jgi:hypothetical protein